MKKARTDRRGRPFAIPTHCGFREDPDYFLDVKIAVDRWCRKNDKMHTWKNTKSKGLKEETKGGSK